MKVIGSLRFRSLLLSFFALAATGGVAALGLTGCDDSRVSVDPGPGTRVLLVVNSIGETLDRIDLGTGHVTRDVLVLGNVPNDVVVDPSRHLFYVANSMANDVWKVDVATDTVQKVIPLGENRNPYLLELLSSGQVAVTEFLAGDVAILDPAAGTVVDHRTVGRAPEGLLETGGRLLATVTDLDFTDYTYGTGEVVAVLPGGGGPRVAVGVDPQAMVVGPDGKIHVVCTGNGGWYEPASFGEIWVLNATSLAVEDTITVGGSPAYAAVVGNSIYLAGYTGGLMKYDGLTHQVRRGADHPVISAEGLMAVIADPDEHRLYVAGFNDDTVYAVDTSADTLVATWHVGDGPAALAIANVPEEGQ